jgi:hypothetical protein
LEYLRELSNQIGLRDWTIVLAPEPTTPGRIAEVVPVYGRKVATIRLSETFKNAPQSVQRHTVVHELIECHFAPSRFVALETLSKRAYAAYQINHEFSVDGLADAIAPFYPLPDFQEA